MEFEFKRANAIRPSNKNTEFEIYKIKTSESLKVPKKTFSFFFPLWGKSRRGKGLGDLGVI